MNNAHNILQTQIKNQIIGQIVIDVNYTQEKITESVTLLMQDDIIYIRPLFCQFRIIQDELGRELLDECEYDRKHEGYEYDMTTSLSYNDFMDKYYNSCEEVKR